MNRDFNKIFESILDDYEGDHSSQASKIDRVSVNPFSPDKYDARTDLFCGTERVSVEQLEDYIDMCRLVSSRFSWEHGDVIVTTSSLTLADSTLEAVYDNECGKTFGGEDIIRISIEYNLPEKLTVENLMNMMLFFTKIDDMMRIILKRDPVYNTFYSYETTDGYIWKYYGRADAIELFNSILYPKTGETRNGNATESLINETSSSIIKMCAMRISARNTIPILRAIFKERNLMMKKRAGLTSVK